MFKNDIFALDAEMTLKHFFKLKNKTNWWFLYCMLKFWHECPIKKIKKLRKLGKFFKLRNLKNKKMLFA